ncbi:MAG: diphthine--ammonia ligase [Halanaerobiales bacterium]
MNKNFPFFCSWSGGKDSCLALYYALQNGGEARQLLTMLVNNGERSRSHGLDTKILKKQAKLLKIPLLTINTTWDNYEYNFIEILNEFKNNEITHGVFGDIDLEEHREWIEKVCDKAGIKPHLPLWQMKREKLLTNFIELGFKTKIVAVKEEDLSADYLNKTLNKNILEEFKKENIDISGENGEYHTVVYDGPIFEKPLELSAGGQYRKKGVCFQNYKLKEGD